MAFKFVARQLVSYVVGIEKFKSMVQAVVYTFLHNYMATNFYTIFLICSCNYDWLFELVILVFMIDLLGSPTKSP